MITIMNKNNEGVYDKTIFKAIFMGGGAGSGKCLKKGTEIIMYDGTLKKVEDIVDGDLIMGDDSSPRKVLSTVNGIDQMYKISQKGAEDYIVNSKHILSLKKSINCNNPNQKRRYPEYENIIDIDIDTFNSKSTKFKKNFYGYKVPIDFLEQDLIIDPYFLGIWLGDGHNSQVAITTIDNEILDYISDYAKQYGYRLYENTKINTKAISYYFRWDEAQNNPLLDTFRSMDLMHNKHIPQAYITNSKENRLKLLAGIIDTDGHFANRKYYDIVMSDKKLVEQIKYVADTLGFRTSMKYKKSRRGNKYFDAWRVTISGDIWRIPCKVKYKIATKDNITPNKDWRVQQIKVTPEGMGEYYGFTIDGNHRFLLKGCTVTHNSFIANLATAGLGFKVVNSDDIFEYFLTKNDLDFDLESLSPEDYAQAMMIRLHAKDLSSKRLDLYLKGRLGIVIDGTGKDYAKIASIDHKLRNEYGYDTSMILVNTTLEVSLARNAKRKRKVRPDVAEDIWYEVQKNLGKFQKHFGQQDFHLIDNSEYGEENDRDKESLYKAMMHFANRKITNPIALKWIQAELDAKRREKFNSDYKRITEQLTELSRQEDLMEWNEIQKNLWVRLVQEGIVRMNDMNKFFKLGELFSNYFDKFNQPAPFEYISQNI